MVSNEKEEHVKIRENYEQKTFQGEKTSWAEWELSRKIFMKTFWFFFVFFQSCLTPWNSNKKLKTFILGSLEELFFCFKTWLRCSRKYRLTIFISLMVAIDLTKRFIRTTAGPSKVCGYIDFSKYVKEILFFAHNEWEVLKVYKIKLISSPMNGEKNFFWR